jgi:hypothetical protein
MTLNTAIRRGCVFGVRGNSIEARIHWVNLRFSTLGNYFGLSGTTLGTSSRGPQSGTRLTHINIGLNRFPKVVPGTGSRGIVPGAGRVYKTPPPELPCRNYRTDRADDVLVHTTRHGHSFVGSQALDASALASDHARHDGVMRPHVEAAARTVDFPIARLDDRARRASEIASCPANPAEASPIGLTIPASPRAMVVGLRSAGVCRVNDEPSALALMVAALSRGVQWRAAQPDPDPTRPRFRKIGRPTPPRGPTPSGLYRAPREFWGGGLRLQQQRGADVAAYGSISRRFSQAKAGAAPDFAAHGGDELGGSGDALPPRRRHVDRRGRGGWRRGGGQPGEGEAVELHLDGGDGLRTVRAVGLRDGLDRLRRLHRGHRGPMIAGGGGNARGDQPVLGELRRAHFKHPAPLPHRFIDGGWLRLQQPRDLSGRASKPRELGDGDERGEFEGLRPVLRALRAARRIPTLAGLERPSACLRFISHDKSIPHTPTGYDGRIVVKGSIR